MARPVKAPEFVIDTSASTESRVWAEAARELAQRWFPLITPLLATDGWSPPKRIRFLFKPDIDAPAYASGSDITISSRWIREHPDDFGVVIHEMTHVIQAYGGPGERPGWLVEGIADYIRWWRFEPESPRTPIDPDRASYRDAYRTTAAFLAWITGRVHRGIVPALDRALRQGTYREILFEQTTGKSLDALWAEYVAWVRATTPALRARR